MAKKNDRKEYNKLKKKKADNKKQQEQCQSEIDVLDEKIERLKAAYRKLDDAKAVSYTHLTLPTNSRV